MNDSKEYTQSKYKALYRTLLHDHNNLKTRYIAKCNEVKSLRAKLEQPIRQNVDANIQRVKDIINREFNVDIDVQIRHRDVIDARSMYYRYMRDNTLMSLQKIAKTLDTNHDHATLYNSLNRHDDNVVFDKVYKAKYELILSKINHEQREANNN